MTREQVRLVLEVWPQVVGVRSGWAVSPADEGQCWRMLTAIWVPAFRRMAVACSRKGWLKWVEPMRVYGQEYADRGDCVAVPAAAGFVIAACEAWCRSRFELGEIALGVVHEAFVNWEAMPWAERLARAGGNGSDRCRVTG